MLTTQYLEEADQLADQIAILHGGRIVAHGTPDELKAHVPGGLVELQFNDDDQLTRGTTGARRPARGQPGSTRRCSSPAPARSPRWPTCSSRLDDAGIEPTGFSRQLPTLDDVFFKILDDDDDDNDKETRHAHAH